MLKHHEIPEYHFICSSADKNIATKSTQHCTVTTHRSLLHIGMSARLILLHGVRETTRLLPGAETLRNSDRVITAVNYSRKTRDGPKLVYKRKQQGKIAYS